MYSGRSKSLFSIYAALAILIVVSIFAAGCTNATELPTQVPTSSAAQVVVASTLTNTPLPSPTSTWTPLPSLTPTLTATATPTPLPTATPLPTLAANLRYPPAVLILHSNSNMDVNPEAKTLDNVKFLEDFLPLLKNSPFTVTTFEKLEADPDIKNPLILMIDQFYWGKILTDQDKRSFELIDEAGYVGVITIVPNPVRRFDNNALVGAYMQKGWEAASHGGRYIDVAGKHWYDVAYQVEGGVMMSGSVVVGRDQFPITYVSPYGYTGDNLNEAIKAVRDWPTTENNVLWLVADVPDKPYDITELTSTVGFMEASSDAKATFDSLVQRFVH